ELHRRLEVSEDIAPGAFVVRAPAVAFVDDDEVEEAGRIVAEVRRLRRVAAVVPTIIFTGGGRDNRRYLSGHERLENGEEQAAVLRHLALLADIRRRDTHERILGKRGERVVGLIGKDVTVGKEQDARPARYIIGF